MLRLLLTVSLLVVIATALPTKNSKLSTAARAKAKTASAAGTRRVNRAKRSVIVEVPEEVIEQQEIEDELSQLSDEQLATLAEIVQRELDQYDPEVPAAEYAIVDIPEEYLLAAQQPLSRPRRGVPLETLQDAEDEMFFEQPSELIVIPEEDYQEALVEAALEEAAEEAIAEEAIKELDEMQLRSRIAEMATILNERASRAARRRR